MERTLVILQKRVPGLTQAALAQFVVSARRAAGVHGDLNVLVTGNAEIRLLNRRFRKKDKATDVLSFPSGAGSFHKRGAFLGDIAISAEMATENACRFSHTAAEEVKVLVLHGLLHLAGFDHERDNGVMARKEAQLRLVLKLPSSLIERVQSRKSHPKKKGRKRHSAEAAKL